MKRKVLIALVVIAALLAGCAKEAAKTEQDPSEPVANPSDSAAASSTPGAARPIEDQTVQILSDMGVMPLEEAVPSVAFALPLLGGESVRMADYLGKVVFLNFWATWCPPCREEMPSMQSLYDELAPQGFEIIAVNVLEPESTVAEFIDEFGYTFPILLDTDGRVMAQYGVRAYPTTYVIDRKGYVLGVRPGGHDWASPAVIGAFRELLDR